MGGVISWVQDNLIKYSPSPVSICNMGKSPSWCSFSKVRRGGEGGGGVMVYDMISLFIILLFILFIYIFNQ